MESCSICLEACTDAAHTLTCGHTFHTQCIVRWLRASNQCPVCRDNPHATPPPGDGEQTLARTIEEVRASRRRYRNYVNRRNRLAREDAEVGGMRASLHKAREAYERERVAWRKVAQEAERRVARDPDVLRARQAHTAARRRFLRANARFNQVTEGLLGPAPQMHGFSVVQFHLD